MICLSLTRGDLNRLVANQSLGLPRPTPTIYLTRRNVLALLSKLDRRTEGQQSSCTIIKVDVAHSTHPLPDIVTIKAVEGDPFMYSGSDRIELVEDELYYSNRAPGRVHPLDDPDRRIA